MCGHRLTAINILPLHWSPDTHRLVLAKRLHISLKLAPLEVEARSIPCQIVASEEMFDRIAKRLVHGYRSKGLPVPEQDAIEYMIITSEALAPEFQRLADYKIANGISAGVRTVEWINANYPTGVDAADRVRLFIQDAYSKSGTLWVLLGGDADVVPTRYAEIELSGSGYWLILTDYYFMCLDGTWNADGDGIFGEAEDNVDLLPEVFAGRAPTSTSEEARTFVDKVISYSERIAEDYPASALFMADELQTGGGPIDGAEFAEELIPILPPNFDHIVRRYELYGNWPGSDLSRVPWKKEMA
jgi:hypothetical protein